MRRITRVKVCGLTRAPDVDAAVNAGADATGFIVGFPRSPRNLSLDGAENLIKRVPTFVDSVLVTNPGTLSRRLDRIREIGPDAIQLHGDLPNYEDVRKELGLSIIKAVSVTTGARSNINSDFRLYDAILTDTYLPGRDGGTGVTSDWEECSRIRKAIHPLPMILSGGLNHANVRRAIAAVRPFAVDVSSGVESRPGKKDARKIVEFVGRVRGDAAD